MDYYTLTSIFLLLISSVILLQFNNILLYFLLSLISAVWPRMRARYVFHVPRGNVLLLPRGGSVGTSGPGAGGGLLATPLCACSLCPRGEVRSPAAIVDLSLHLSALSAYASRVSFINLKNGPASQGCCMD